MTDETPGLGPDQPDQVRRTRAASVTLRDRAGADRDVSEPLDAANKSLMDALRFSYFLMGVAMAILAMLYVASGFQSIAESERGVRLSLGRVIDAKLMPGPQWALPFPFGEIVRVSAGVERVSLNEEFWPALSERQKQQDPSQLTPTSDLSPERDGFLITADTAIAHTRWVVQYSKGDEPRNFAQNVFPDAEEEIVRAAVSRGIIQAVASISIEDLLRAGDNNQIHDQARLAAQRVLDSFHSGIQIDDLTMTAKTPPISVRASFELVQSAESTSNKTRQEANTVRNGVLNRVAGAAAGALIDLIDRYEDALELKDDEAAEQILARINMIFDGEPIELGDGEKHPSISGEVSQILSDARSYRTSVVVARRAEAIEFAGKQALFLTNPLVLVHSEWVRGIEAFYDRLIVNTTIVPVGTGRLTMIINQDPEFEMAYQKAAKAEANRKAAEERERRRRDQQRSTDTESRIMDTGG